MRATLAQDAWPCSCWECVPPSLSFPFRYRQKVYAAFPWASSLCFWSSLPSPLSSLYCTKRGSLGPKLKTPWSPFLSSVSLLMAAKMYSVQALFLSQILIKMSLCSLVCFSFILLIRIRTWQGTRVSLATYCRGFSPIQFCLPRTNQQICTPLCSEVLLILGNSEGPSGQTEHLLSILSSALPNLILLHITYCFSKHIYYPVTCFYCIKYIDVKL